jgi:branched-chain amino acid aminotransferase
MTQEITKKIWHNGKFINWQDANVHVMSHVIHYGSSFFEGVRCYETPRGPAIFRLQEHLERLINSCHIYRCEVPFSVSQLMEAAIDVVRENEMKSCYLRPIVFRGYGTFGVNPLTAPIEVYIACWPWGAYLGKDALASGVDVCISSWTRIAPDTLPAMAKCGANYMNSQLIKMEAIANGYAEGIALDHSGYISEGSGENIFLVRNGEVMTPPLNSSILPGITRDSIIQICRDNNIPVVERALPREALYICDEAFFTGTACEITPIRSVDRINIGKGARGPITEFLQSQYMNIVQGKAEDKYGWLTYLPAAVKQKRAGA